MRFHYEDRSTTPHYKCSQCGAEKVKLWRGYNSMHVELLCMTCVGKAAGKPVDWNESDSCGWHVPAVPTEVGDTYWGYSSVPLRGCRWWHQLEPLAQRDRHPEYFLDDHGWLDHLTVGARDGAWYLRRYFRPEALTVAIRMVARAAPAEGLSIVRRFRTRTGSYRVAGRRFRTAELARRWMIRNA